MRPILLLSLVSVLAHLQSGGGQKGAKSTTLAKTMFEAGADGWVVEGKERNQILQLTETIKWSPLSIEVLERTSQTWYFANSGSLAGDLTAAYGGRLSFRLHSSKQPPPTTSSRRNAGRGVPDVILESSCGTSLTFSGLVEPGRSASTVYEVELSEGGGWVDARTGVEALQLDILGTLANLETLKIRGSFFPSGLEEGTVLRGVEIQAPRTGARPLRPCCLPGGHVGICQRNAEENQQKFDCRGSFQQTIRVATVFPRYGRRSGGFSVTVTGENFGLSGSQPILRIHGSTPVTCKYPLLEFLPHNAPDSITLYDKTCRDGLLTSGEDKIDCGGSLCPPCVMPLLPGTCKNGVIDAGETEVGKTIQRDGVKYDCGGNCLTNAHCCNGIRDQDERGIDCGGSRCLACNPLGYVSGGTLTRGVISADVVEIEGCMCNVAQTKRTINGTVLQEEIVVATDDNSTSAKSCFAPEDIAYYNLTNANCSNVVYLHGNDPVIDSNFYVNKRIYLTDGQGAGQSGVIDSYDYRTKRAVIRGPWQGAGGFAPTTIEEVAAAPKMRTIGSVRIVRAGLGYKDGVWRLPLSWVSAGTTKDATYNNVTAAEGFGTFKVDREGRIISAEIWSAGRYPGATSSLLIFIARATDGSNPADRADLGQPTSYEVKDGNIQCGAPCLESDGSAVFAADLLQNPQYLRPPSRGTRYMILGEPGTEGADWNTLFSHPVEPEHGTLICTAPESPLVTPKAKASRKLEVSVEVRDRFAGTHSSCPLAAPEAMGFEFGGLSMGWSLQISARQAGAFVEMRVADMKTDNRNGDIYLAGRIQGACTEQSQGCLGFQGKHLPNRGIFSSGSFKQLILSPSGLITTWLARLDSSGSPMWATIVDASNRFGVVDNPSLALDYASGPTRVHLAGLYIISQGNNLRLWHVNQSLGTPQTFPRVAAVSILAGVGACNSAKCDATTGECTKEISTRDTLDCNNPRLGLTFRANCNIDKCMYVRAFESARGDIPDLYFAEFSSEGQVVSIRERISMGQGGSSQGAAGVTFVGGSLMMTTTGDAAMPNAANDGSNAQGLYISMLIHWSNVTSDPKWRINLGRPARELFLLDDYDQIPPLTLSLPRSDRNGPQYWALAARLSPSGPIWARLVGPLSTEVGGTAGHVGFGGDYYSAGTYVAGDAPYFQGCKFGGAPNYAGVDKGCTTAGGDTCAGKSNVPYVYPVCWPVGTPNARWTGESFDDKSGVWSDVSGNGWHGAVTRGKPMKVGGWKDGSKSFWGGAYVEGGVTDGAQFPLGAIPAQFTMCSVTKGGDGGGGAVLDGSSEAGWVHGHYQGVIGYVQYGTGAPVTSMPPPPEWADAHAWVVVCSQNDPEADSVTNIDGRHMPRAGGSGGGLGDVALGVNDGNVGLTQGYVQSWGVWEIVVWDRYLTSFEVDAVVEYYRSLLRYSLEKDSLDPTLPPRIPHSLSPHNLDRAQLRLWDQASQGTETYRAIANMFAYSLKGTGEVKWHRDAIGGNLTAMALAVARPDGVWNSSSEGGVKTSVYIVGKGAGEWRHADFGVTRWPRDCSAESERLGAPVGSRHTLGEGSKANPHTACSGLFSAKGRNTDIFLVKYSGDTGEAAWVRRLGQGGSDEVPTGITVDPVRREIYVVGSYYTRYSTRRYYDAFDLVAAGRGSEVGCPMDTTDGEFKERLYGRFGPSGNMLPPVLDNDSVGAPNCSFITHTGSPGNPAGFIIAIDDDDSSVGRISAPWGQCVDQPPLLGGPSGCNSDGVLWAKMLHGGGQESLSNVAQSQALGVIYSPLGRTTGSLLAWGTFRGWLKATQTKGLRTPGFDDDGFYNCCAMLQVPLLLDENQDIYEGYIMSLLE